MQPLISLGVSSILLVPMIAAVASFETSLAMAAPVMRASADPANHAGDVRETRPKTFPEASRVPTMETVRAMAPIGPGA